MLRCKEGGTAKLTPTDEDIDNVRQEVNSRDGGIKKREINFNHCQNMSCRIFQVLVNASQVKYFMQFNWCVGVNCEIFKDYILI